MVGWLDGWMIEWKPMIEIPKGHDVIGWNEKCVRNALKLRSATCFTDPAARAARQDSISTG
jgi:hypothetical protein